MNIRIQVTRNLSLYVSDMNSPSFEIRDLLPRAEYECHFQIQFTNLKKVSFRINEPIYKMLQRKYYFLLKTDIFTALRTKKVETDEP